MKRAFFGVVCLLLLAQAWGQKANWATSNATQTLRNATQSNPSNANEDKQPQNKTEIPIQIVTNATTVATPFANRTYYQDPDADDSNICNPWFSVQLQLTITLVIVLVSWQYC